jgi:iron complex outermembrane receptor protein
MNRLLLFLFLSLFFDFAAFAQEELPVYELENIEVIEKTEQKQTTEVITKEDIEIKGTSNLWQIMGTLPGVVLTGGGERNESNFRLRGFDAARVPIYVDGVSQAIPYRGDADHARILTYDLESIEVQKGYSSMLMGADNLGGIINLTVAKPKKRFEAAARYGIEFDNIFKRQQNLYLASVGSKQNIFYGKATAVLIDRDHFRLPDEFRPKTEYQPDHERKDASEQDSKITLIAGFTPLDKMDAHITYVRQRGEKMSPGDISVSNPRIWDWPRWDRDSVSLNADYDPKGYYIKALAYYDKYDNRLFNTRPHGIPSDYDDFAAGAKLQGGLDINSWNNFQASAMWKTENHKGHDNITGIYSKEIEIEQYTYSFGAEYSVTPWKPLTLALGAGYDQLVPMNYWTASRGSESFDTADTLDGLVYQAGLFYNITENHELHATFARKAHFPTMTERFSSRYDVAIPNPTLMPEFARHYELGYRGLINHDAKITAAVYYSDFRDKILQELIREPVTGQVVTHSINKDRWLYYGAELSGEWYVNDNLQAGIAFSYNKSDNRFDRTVRDTYYPSVTSNGYMVIKPNENISVIPRYEHTSSRYTSADASVNHRIGEYTLLYLSVKAENILEHIMVEFAVDNILDRYYEIKEYYPLAGRTFSLTVSGNY